MGLSLKPEHLRRYRDMAVLLLKYGRSDMVFNAGLGMEESDPVESAPADGSNKDDLADDLEALGPTFVREPDHAGLILAAMIIGAAMLMRVETSFRIIGYPGLAMLFFLGAALGASWMAFGILRDDHHHTRRPTSSP